MTTLLIIILITSILITYKSLSLIVRLHHTLTLAVSDTYQSYLQNNEKSRPPSDRFLNTNIKSIRTFSYIILPTSLLNSILIPLTIPFPILLPLIIILTTTSLTFTLTNIHITKSLPRWEKILLKATKTHSLELLLASLQDMEAILIAHSNQSKILSDSELVDTIIITQELMTTVKHLTQEVEALNT